MKYSSLVLSLTFLSVTVFCSKVRAEEPSASSWEKPVTPPAAVSSAATQINVIAEGELATGESVKITELKRSSGDTVTLKFVISNTTSEETPIEVFGGDWYNWDMRNVFLLDVPNKKKYFTLKDGEGNTVSSRGKGRIKPGEQRTFWAKFPAPPVSVSSVSVEIPTAAPFDDLPIKPQG